MCCQPPKKIDDIEYFYRQNVKRILSAPKDLTIIGITGGEPTLLGDKLISLIELIRTHLPQTAIHILTNGRNFVDYNYAQKVSEVAEGYVTMGIPLHSDYAKDHDIIAGAKNAFNETMLGLYNLAMHGVGIELRVVVNKLNYLRLPQMANFIFKNLSFVRWTAFMGMERVGFAETKNNKIWIEPIEYIEKLCTAVQLLDDFQQEAAIYNIPLCLLPINFHKFAEKSISDWKNKYLDICNSCKMKQQCCGFFATSTVPYSGIKAYL
jgi:His-Xaa-Ser system radical SAM maturase HxsC